MNKEEENVRDFYDQYGWVQKAGVSLEDKLFREMSPPYYRYHEGADARTLQCFADLNGRLLLAGAGDLPKSHVAIANQFSETTCLDISKVAIDITRNKLEGRGEFVLGSILDIPKPHGTFNASYCAHVIYHIARDRQDKAVRELIRVTKPGGRVIVIYINPDSLPNRLAGFKGRLPLLRNLKRKNRPDVKRPPGLYFFTHPLSWWAQFHDECEIALKPWDIMSKGEEDALLINDVVASLVYRFCTWFENKYPDTAARWWSYPLVILTKKVHE
jgi:SAM-dependent methyltransferase